MTYTCKCCGYSKEFTSPEEAFQAGWDTPERFGFLAPLCDLCPTTAWAKMVVIDGEQCLREPFPDEPILHAVCHERWAKQGRPEEFNAHDCIP